MRRIVAISLTILASVALLTGCKPLVAKDPTLSVYATFYPVYTLTDAVTKNVPDLELHCLVQPQDGCLRAYALSNWDAVLLTSGADAIIAGGRGLESFEHTLFDWGESGPAITAVLYNLELYNSTEGETGNPESESHLEGANPHLYMSIDGAKHIIESISASMVSMDPDYSEHYIRNAGNASRKLDELLKENRKQLAAYKGKEVVLMNEALIYAARDYDLVVSDWIDRESGAAMADNELDPCLERLSRGGAKVILIEKQAPQALIEALETAGFAVARMDVFSTHREGEGFERYLDIQRDNARAIQEAFGRTNAMEVEH